MNTNIKTINYNLNNEKENDFDSRLLDHYYHIKKSFLKPKQNFIKTNYNKDKPDKSKKNLEKDSISNINSFEMSNKDINIKEKTIQVSLNNNFQISPIRKNQKKYISINPNVNLDLYTTNKDEENSSREIKLDYLMSENFKNSSEISNTQKEKSFNYSYSKLNNTKYKKNDTYNYNFSKEKKEEKNISNLNLYEKSIINRDLKNKKAASEIKNRKKEEIKNCSFNPKLCEKSISMIIKVIIYNYLESYH